MASTEEEINLRLNGLSDAERELNDVARGATRAARITDHLARTFDNLEDEATEAQRALDRVNDEIRDNGATAELTAELTRLQQRLSDISNDRRITENMRAEFRRATESAQHLDRQLAETRRELDRLNREYAEGGDPAVLRRIQEQRRALDELNAHRRRIASEDEQNQARLARLAEETRRARARREEEEDNRTFLRRMRRRIGGSGDFLQGAPVPPQAAAVGAAIGGAAAVPLLAAIGGALTGAVGAGVAGAGIAGAVMGNPEAFKTEWAAAVGTVKEEFLGATEVFAGPTLDAIKTIGPLVQSWDLDEVFADAAGYVPMLVKGVEGLASGIVRGVSAMVAKGEPAVEGLTSGLAELGDAAGDAFESIANGAEGGGEALRDTLTLVGNLVRAFGDVVEGAEKAYSYIHDHPIEATVASGGLAAPLVLFDQLSDRSQAVSGNLRTLGTEGAAAGDAIEDAWEGAAAAMQDSLDTANALFDAQMGSTDANVAWEQSIDDLTESIKENGRNWDITTQKGRDNTTALQDSINAAKAVRDANIENGMSVAEANKKYEAQIEYLRGVAAKAGLTKEQFDAMTKALLNYINTPQDKTITTKFIDIHYVSQEGRIGSGEDPRTRTGRAYASGGSVAETGFSLVGEQGPELRFLSKGDYIATAQQTKAMLAGGGGGGVATIRVILQYPDGRVIRDELVTTAANQGQTVGGYLGV